MSNKNGWKPFKLEELGFVGRGRSRNRPRNEPSLYGGKYPFFQTGDIKAADLYLTKYTQTYNEKGLAQSKLWSPGTLCITIAANIAETAILGIEACFPDSVVGFIANPKKSDPRFIKYYIDTIKLSMQNVSKGTTQDNLSLDKLQRFDFVVPDVTTQRKIASILAAYDDLIENNTRRIAILEEMAQAIYREWFVNFRFPGYENTKFVESPLGQIPEGWEASQFGEVATFENGDRGKNYPKSSQFVDEGIPFVNAGHLVNGVVNLREVNRITEDTFARLSRGKIRAGDLLFCVRGSLGRIARAGSLNTGAIASSLVIIRESEEVGKAYLYYTLSGSNGQEMVSKLDNGVAQPNISVQSVKRYPLLLPSRSVLAEFENWIQPLWEETSVLHSKCDNLRTTRDLLLPKLISGQLDVENLEIDKPESVEDLTETTA